MHQTFTFLVGLLCLSLVAQNGQAQTPSEFDPLVTQWVRMAIPKKYEDNRKWGQTKEVFAGIRIRRRGLKILTRRRTKRVNHGTWKKYRVQMLDPKKLDLKYGKLTKTESGRARFSVAASGDLVVFARFSHWERGVQLFSVGVDADARVTMNLTCEAGLRTGKSLIPSIGVELKVLQADLQIHRFRLHRLSNIRGPVAREIGRGVEYFLKRYLKKNQHKLVQKLNKSIEKKKDRLEISLGRWLKRE